MKSVNIFGNQNKALSARTAGAAGLLPDAATLESYGVNVKNLKNGRVQPLYDSIRVSNGVVGPQNFFTVPVGTGGKTLADTNLRQNGQLAAGVSHFTTGISARIIPRAVGANDRIIDLRAIGELFKGYFQFNILDVEKFVVAPLSSIPARVGLEGAVASVAPGGEITFAAYRGDDVDFVPFYIQSGQSFNGVLNFPSAVTLTADVDIFVYLHGLMFTPVT